MDVTRLIDLFPYQLEKFPKSDALAAKENGVWKKYSTAEVLEVVNNLSYGLLNAGIKPEIKSVLFPITVLNGILLTMPVCKLQLPMFRYIRPSANMTSSLQCINPKCVICLFLIK